MSQSLQHRITSRACLVLLLLGLAACKNGDSANNGANAAKQIPGVPPPVKGASPKGGGWKCGDKVCSFSMGEDCMVCPKDCKPCDGCQRKIGEGCTDCKCEACVCKKYPKCCKRGHGWTRKCVDHCKKECGGCGLLKNRPTGPPTKGGTRGGSVPPLSQGASSWKCGDGKCVVASGEDCHICPKDCGQCDGCQVKVGADCPNCKCGKCVCKKLPSCCSKTGTWGKKCVKACKEQCGGCGVTKAVGSATKAAPPGKVAGATQGVPKTLSATCGNNRCELALGEDCESCAKDCSRCNGCLPKLGPGCRNCKCAKCVCKKLPECCAAKGRWSIRCVEACREKCGGCGVKAGALAAPPAKAASPAPATAGAAATAAARCGDGTCDPGSEDCILCAKDCGNCNGCQAKLGPGCLLCKCEACVCKKRPSCCKASGKWDETCAALCKKDCGGCGLTR